MKVSFDGMKFRNVIGNWELLFSLAVIALLISVLDIALIFTELKCTSDTGVDKSFFYI